MNEGSVDIAVIGCGPAGLQAAIHAARRKCSVLVLGRVEKSNAAKGHMENYFAVERIDGLRMLEIGCRQAASFGAEFAPQDVGKLARDGELGPFVLTLESRRTVRAKAIVVATGVSLERLNVPGEKEYLGKGVSYCVDCDANFFRGKRVAVVGNGSAAAEGALTLLRYASAVHLVAAEFAVDATLRAEIESSAVTLHNAAKAARIEGAAAVERLVLADGSALAVDGVFIELGAKGVMELTIDLGVELDPESFKYVVVDRAQKTNVPGVVAAGDITGGHKQIAKAVGEGCVAGLSAAEYVRGLRT
jgi:thioredoxin reductase (NADPH)